MAELRRDPYLNTPVHVVPSRQDRPNLPSTGCPFCVGGLEAPEPYTVKAFPNRWPALGDQRCEVVLYSPRHDATFASLDPAEARAVIDLWADRTQALRELPDVEYVLVFENRGAEVGATIAHPHGQIYAYDHVPPRQARRLHAGWRPDPNPRERLVTAVDGWQVVVPYAPVFPVAVSIAPTAPLPDLVAADESQRTALAALLIDTFTRLDRLYGQPLPLMMWLHQSPTTTADAPPHWFEIEIVSPWRSAGVSRFIAAAEVACEEYFNPVDPADLASRLRDAG